MQGVLCINFDASECDRKEVPIFDFEIRQRSLGIVIICHRYR